MNSDDDPELDEIARAFDALPDRPDPAVRAAHLELAQAEFARMHGAPAPVRGAWARRLWASVAGPGAVGALTAAAAVGFVVLTPAGRGLLDPFAVQETGPGQVPEAAAEKTPEVEVAAETAPAPLPETEAPVAATAAESAPAEAPEAAATGEVVEPVAPMLAAPAPEAAGTSPAPEAAAEATRSLAETAEAATQAVPGEGLADATSAVEAQAGGAADRAAGAGGLVAMAPAATDGMQEATMVDPVREALEAGRLPAPGEVRVADLLRDAGIAPEAPEVLAAVAPWDNEATVVVALLPFWPGQAARVDWDEEVEARPLDEGLPAEGPLPPDLAVMAWVVAGGAPDGSPGTLGFRGPIPFAGEAEKVAVPIAVEGGPRASLAAVVVGWALLLRGEDLGPWRAGDAVALAQGAPEVARLMRLSEPLLAR